MKLISASGEVDLRTSAGVGPVLYRASIPVDVPGHATPVIITDAAVNIAPSLGEKRDITQNAIDLAQALGVESVRVAILSATESVNAKMPSTLDAAALCKMADRGQITGGILDGADLAPWPALILKLGSVDQETDDEEEPVQRRADHRHPEGAAGRAAGG